MIPDFFFCSAPQSPERYERACETLAMWRKVVWPVTVLQAEPGNSFYFQSERRKMAERLATTPIYIVADDDIEPSALRWPGLTLLKCQLYWLEVGLEMMEKYPQFGILSPLLEKTTLFPATVDGSPPFVNTDVQEEHNVGGIRFCRKGIITEWPEQLRRGYDQEHCAAYQQHGYKVGYMKHLWAIHPGKKSETWKPVTDYICPKLPT